MIRRIDLWRTLAIGIAGVAVLMLGWMLFECDGAGVTADTRDASGSAPIPTSYTADATPTETMPGPSLAPIVPVGFRGDRLWDDGPKASFPAARHRGFFLSNFLRCFCGLL